ncbi:hypothetical protein V5O48_018385, partial [Marasmius crinis-equi]
MSSIEKYVTTKYAGGDLNPWKPPFVAYAKILGCWRHLTGEAEMPEAPVGATRVTDSTGGQTQT